MIKNKTAVIIPTRGDREKFLNFSLDRLKKQTFKPDEIIIVNDTPKNSKKDITWRYRKGLERAKNLNCNMTFFWEDDDWYDYDYLEWMYSNWEKNGYPLMFGINETYYYHIKVKKYNHMQHPKRASAFAMMASPLILDKTWPADDNPFLDLFLWTRSASNLGIAIPFNDKIRCIGIKHGIGMVGGAGHDSKFKWLNEGKEWFQKIVDEESFNFYNTFK